MYRHLLCVLTIWAWTPALTSAQSSSLLAISDDGMLLLSANRDNGSISLSDVAELKTIREISVGRTPESVAWVGKGPLAVAACYHADQVVIVNTETGETDTIDTPVEPYGIVVHPEGNKAYVTCEYPGLVCELDLSKKTISRKIPVGPFVRGIAFKQSADQLLVTHYYSGNVSAVDLKKGEVVDQWLAPGTENNLARQISVHPSIPYAYVPHIRSRIDRAHGSGSIFPYVSVLDLVPKEEREDRIHPIPMDSFVSVTVTANPWETAVSPDGKRHYTVFAGTDDIAVSEVLHDDYRYLQPVTRILPVGRNPRAVIVSPDSKKVFVFNTLDFAVAVHQADSFRKIGDIKVSSNPYSEEVLLGKVLFNLAKQPMSRRKWISCASCHPDGDHDGRTWQNPEGLRRTTHFFGMSRTYPIHWSADRDELQDFEHTIRGPLMQGRGLINGDLYDGLGEANAGRSAAADALAAYCNSFEHSLSPHLIDGKLSPAAQRGKKLFYSEATNCASCHSGSDFTDRKMHDVGTGKDDPSEKMGTKYDTPTLLRAYRNLSYLHDGSATTLRDVLTTANPNDLHGKTSHLTESEVDDLVAFLKSLPYELP